MIKKDSLLVWAIAEHMAVANGDRMSVLLESVKVGFL